MKLLTVAVPCYNSAAYMRHCVDSLLSGGDEMEIIIVNDGSTKDDTAQIADEYAQKYPGIIRAIHKENGGHGDAVMTGIQNATGLYFKVVDSDDWVDEIALQKVLETLRGFAENERPVDLLVSNYIYDKVDAAHKHVVRYANALPENRVIDWAQANKFRVGQYILMHAAIYRTALLRECGLRLPKHTFYVDNLYVYVPMQQVETLYYLNVDLYHYYIGREDQSVNEQVMIKRIDQQLRVNYMMIDAVDLTQIAQKQKRKYMRNYLEIVTTVSSVLLVKAGTDEALQKKQALWDYMKAQNPAMYMRIRYRLMGVLLHLRGKPGRKLVVWGYKASRRIVGFN